MGNHVKQKFKIWYQTFDETGNVTGTGVYHKDYLNYGTALNIARKQFGDKNHFIRYTIGMLNPFEEHSKKSVCDICGETHIIPVDPTFGNAFETEHVYISSKTILPEDTRIRFHKGYNICPDCMIKIKNFIDSITVVKEVTNDE